MKKSDLKASVVRALTSLGGSASVAEVAKKIWEVDEADLRASGDLFYTWQYDMRWAAQKLSDEGRLAKKEEKRRWKLLK